MKPVHFTYKHAPTLALVLWIAACTPTPPKTPPETLQHNAPTCIPPDPIPTTAPILAGTGAALPLMRSLASQYRTTHPTAPPLQIPNSIGTRGALRALQDRTIQAGLGSRLLKPHEHNATLRERIIAHCPLVFVTHPDTTPNPHTVDQLAALYRGTSTHWPDQTPVVPLLREEGDSGLGVLRTMTPTLHNATEFARRNRPIILTTDQNMHDAILQTPGSIGFLGIDIVQLERSNLNIVPLQDAPSWTRPLTILTPSPPDPRLDTFLRFLASDEARTTLRNAGCTPHTPQGAPQ